MVKKRASVERPYACWTMSAAEFKSHIVSALRNASNKICNKCLIEKDIEFFLLRKDTWKYRNECKSCNSKAKKDYIKNNWDKIKVKNAEYKRTEIWRLSCIANNKRRNWKIKAMSDWTITKESIQMLLYMQYNKCPYCNKDIYNYSDMHLDHIIPISKWWEHSMYNVQWVCKNCNLSKNNNIW